MRCAVCTFFVPEGRSRRSVGSGDCRRLPPTVLIDHSLIYSKWPSVGMNDWCGEFVSAIQEGRPKHIQVSERPHVDEEAGAGVQGDGRFQARAEESKVRTDG